VTLIASSACPPRWIFTRIFNFLQRRTNSGKRAGRGGKIKAKIKQKETHIHASPSTQARLAAAKENVAGVLCLF
jgi:hypothetical protein